MRTTNGDREVIFRVFEKCSHVRNDRGPNKDRGLCQSCYMRVENYLCTPDMIYQCIKNGKYLYKTSS